MNSNSWDIVELLEYVVHPNCRFQWPADGMLLSVLSFLDRSKAFSDPEVLRAQLLRADANIEASFWVDERIGTSPPPPSLARSKEVARLAPPRLICTFLFKVGVKSGVPCPNVF